MGHKIRKRSAAGKAQGGRHLNALKHGQRSDAVLLPGDDAAEFQERRGALFHTYQPRTEDEAECVELMAELRWRMRRCRPWQARADAQVDAASATPGGKLPEPDTHLRLHSTIDCTLHQQRIHRMLCRERDKLLELQKLRRLHVIAGEEQDYLSLLGRGSPPPRQEERSAAGPPDGRANSHHDGENGKSSEREFAAVAVGSPAAPPATRQPLQAAVASRTGIGPPNGGHGAQVDSNLP